MDCQRSSAPKPPAQRRGDGPAEQSVPGGEAVVGRRAMSLSAKRRDDPLWAFPGPNAANLLTMGATGLKPNLIQRGLLMKRNKILSWCVHAYTALGLIIAALMAILIVQGEEAQFQIVLVLVLVALAIDSTDGWLASRLRVGEHAPAIDGRRLDDIIDFHTYTSLPLLLIWRSGLLSGGSAWLLLIPLLASAYGFAQTDAKTEDDYFLGFPSYWNVIALYLILLRPDTAFVIAALLIFSALTFIPAKYLHTSRPGKLSTPTNILGVLWGILVLAIVTGQLNGDGWILGSLIFPVYYLAASWAVTLTQWKAARSSDAAGAPTS